MEKNISQYEPFFGDLEAKALAEYMQEGGWITEFRKTLEFEKAICDFTGAEHAVAVNNGTVALSLAAMAAGIKTGDRVLVPDYTMIATATALSMFGAEPVFVDVEPGTLCMDIEKARQSLDGSVKGVMLVLPNGRYPDAGIDEWLRFASDNNLVLIEDAAQGLGSVYPDGRHLGTVGTVGTLSFSAPKIISTGQGGMVLTNDASVADSVRRLKDFGRAAGGCDIHDTIGYNFKFTELQAVVGLAQMQRLEGRIARKKEIFRIYEKELSGLDGVRMFDHNLETTVPWFVDSVVRERDKLSVFLRARGIGTRDMYPPLHGQKAYNIEQESPVAEMIGRDGLWLPSHPQLEDDDIKRVCREIKVFYTNGV